MQISHHSLSFLHLLLLFMLYLSETRNLLEISVKTEVMRASSSAWRAIQDVTKRHVGSGNEIARTST